MLSIIIPTLGNRLIELKRLLSSLQSQTSKQFEIICVVQDNHEAVKSLLKQYDLNIKVLLLNRYGLSYARNEALKHVGEDVTYITFSDDDCWYPPHAIERVQQLGFGFKTCYCFQIFDPTIEKYYKSYSNKLDENISLRNSLKISSIEIFVSKSIINTGILFDERFGLGTKYPSGEENIFLFDIINQGYEIKYFPEIIVYHLKPIWKNKEYIFKGKGALFARLYGNLKAFFLIYVYAILKYRHSENIIVDLKNMINEVSNFKN